MLAIEKIIKQHKTNKDEGIVDLMSHYKSNPTCIMIIRPS